MDRRDALPAAKLRELHGIVHNDAGLAHTVMTVAALTAHAEVVDWCLRHTEARPWVVATTPLCGTCVRHHTPAFAAQCRRAHKKPCA